jgi:outer membrane protein insertion porin family
MVRVRSQPARRSLERLIFLLSIAVAGGQRSAAQQFEGHQISEIQFEPADQPVASSELNAILPLKPMTALRMTDVRTTIERLYATGRYEYIEVRAEPAGAEVKLVIATRNSWFIGRVSATGKVGAPPNTGQLVNATELNLGEPFIATDVKKAEDKVRNLLVNNGYYQAAVTSTVKYSDIAQQVNIDFLVDSGRRSHFAPPKLSGDIQLSENVVIKATKWKKWFGRGWQPVTQTRIRDGLDGVRSKFEKNDRLLATVQLKSLDNDAETYRATPELEINAGPKVEIKAIGAKVKRKKLEQNVPVFQERSVDNDLLEEGKQNLKEEFQAAGYFDAEVEFKQQNIVNGTQEIDYEITPGERHRFVSLKIEGNKYFQTEAVRERMFLTPRSFQYRHGRYSEAFIRRDEESIANLYRSNGFRDAIVKAETIDDYGGKAGDVGVVVRITEGPQYIVSKLTIEGTEKVSIEKIRSTLSSTPGQPFSEYSVAKDRETIVSYYYEDGYAAATLEYASKQGAKPTDVELTYRIVEGKRQVVRGVIFSGLGEAKPKLVERQLRFGPGDPLSPIKMAEAQRRLYDLGIFAKVDVAVQNPDGDEEEKYVVYDVEEARRYSVITGFGAQLANIGGSNAATSLSDPAGAAGFSPRVSLDVTRIDLFGLGHTISFRSRYSSFDRRAQIDYLAPKPFGLEHFDFTFNVLYDDSHDVRTFSATREEASIQATHRIVKALTGFYKFTYRNVNTSDLKISPLLLPHIVQSVRIGMISTNFIQDRRDDPVDAHKGMYNTLELGWASHYFGSESDFVRVLARNATYHPITKKLIFARQTSFGVEPAFHVSPNTDPSDPIPLPERFYAGGGNSMRGFPENQAGPRDPQTGFPLGGSALFFNNLELRYPVFGDTITGVLFHDMGNIFDKLSDVSLRFRQQNLTDFNYTVHAVGIGIRYRTPIGPLRLDLAYSINPPAFNGFSGTYDQLVQCSANNSCGAPTLQHVSHFQFFFSIGQAF